MLKADAPPGWRASESLLLPRSWAMNLAASSQILRRKQLPEHSQHLSRALTLLVAFFPVREIHLCDFGAC